MMHTGSTFRIPAALLLLGFLVGGLCWFFAPDKHGKLTPTTMCHSNMKQLYFAVMVYQSDFDGLPPALDLSTTLTRYIREDRVLVCPAARGGVGYAINRAVVTRRTVDIANRADTVLIYEADHGRPAPSRHSVGFSRRGSNVLFADGKVRFLDSVTAESLLQK